MHDAGAADIRAPTHKLTIDRDVLRTRRRIAAQPTTWALSPDGLRSLGAQAWPAASHGDDTDVAGNGTEPVVEAVGGDEGEDISDVASPLDAEFAAIDAVLARSDAVRRMSSSSRASNCEIGACLLHSMTSGWGSWQRISGTFRMLPK